MKKFAFFFILFLCTELTFGQFNFGIKIGYNANKLNTNIDSIKSSISSGFQVGVFFRIGKRLYVQPEAYYTFSGGLFEENLVNTVSNWKQKVTVGSLDIPVLLGFKIIKSKIFNWRVMAGPEVSFVVNSKVKDMNSVTGPLTTSDLSKVNWYIQVGTGVDILFLALDIRYQIGLNKIINSVSQGSVSYDYNSMNNMFLVSLGFKIL